MGHFDNEVMTFVEQVYQRADTFLFGRRTYELFAGYWGVRADTNPIAAALNTRPCARPGIVSSVELALLSSGETTRAA
jgi:dihydrofolate reductase